MRRDLRDAAGRVRRPAGVVLGLALVAGWLAAWRWASDAADLFAPATALAGLVVLALARLCRPEEAWASARVGLRVAGGVALGLAVAASLSLGAFLPAGLAAWASPVLGRFGGAAALALLAAGLALAAATGLARRRDLLLDAIVACALAAAWVATQVPRQAGFPPPPATGALLAPRFALLLALGAALALLAALGWSAERRSSDERRAPAPSAPVPPRRGLEQASAVLGVLGTSDEQAERGAPGRLALLAKRARLRLPRSRLPTPGSRLPSAVLRLPSSVSRLAYRWAGLIAAVGLAGALLAGWGGWYAF
ncbi:MAG TPA: hypothetical protein VFW96_21515, partial [Thermomicrobiales bacterium]|nr:hypothetical protein [Thermomicrobiales bacterium]